MTPFDPVALWVMLLTFYPQPIPANITRALIERPEYFAGAAQIGTSGDAIRLPDGRIFDLIFNVGALDGSSRWQVIIPGATVNDPNRIELVAGPLAPIDVAGAVPVHLDPRFAELAGFHLAQVAGGEGAIAGRAGELAAAADPREMQEAFDAANYDGERALYNHLATFGELDPSAGIAATSDRGTVITDAQSDYPDPDAAAPPDFPIEGDPEPTPPVDGDNVLWIQP